MHNDPETSPINALPAVVVALFLMMAGIELIFGLGARGLIGGPQAVGWRIDAIETYGFSGEILRWMIETGRTPPEHLMRFVTFPFVHWSFTHALFACVILLAMGKWVGEALGPIAVLAVFFGSAIGGALFYGLVIPGHALLIGGYPGVYGLIGAYSILLFLKLGQVGQNQLQAFRMLGILIGLQLFFAVVFGSAPDWVADIAGAVIGALLGAVFVPGALQAVLARLRNR